MNSQLQTIINIANSYIGTKESPPDSNNVIFNTVYYGKQVTGSAYAWCAVFVWFVFKEANLSSIFCDSKKMNGCTSIMNYAKEKKQFFTDNFKPGDLALFNWDGKKNIAHHIGIILNTDTKYVYTVEGNTAQGRDSDGGEVMKRTRTYNQIIGVYRPEYKEEKTSMDITQIKKELINISGTGNAHSQWATLAIKEMTEKGIFKGDGEGNYGWDMLVTREVLATVISNVMKTLKTED